MSAPVAGPVAGPVEAAAALAPWTADPRDRRAVQRATGALAAFNRAGVLVAADVHVAARLGRTLGESRDEALLAAALAVRAVRTGSVCLDLTTVSQVAPDLDWPAPEAWTEVIDGSPLLTGGALTREGPLLYLQRYGQEEREVARAIQGRCAAEPPALEEPALQAALSRYFPADSYAEQRAAAELACRGWLSVVTGGPGTGKTTTVARFIGALLSAVSGEPPLRVALAAPTGKAAARMGQAVAEAAAQTSFPADHRETVGALRPTTLHRLLGAFPGSTRSRHHRGNPLPHDVVVVDETSMVSLAMMARLLAAVRPDARLVLVGDADQLASVDAGAVLSDLVEGLARSGTPRVARLRTTHRFGQRIGALAEAVRVGDADAALGALEAGPGSGGQVQLVGAEDAGELMVAATGRLVDAAVRADPAAATRALEGHRLLSGHREGPFGVRSWNRRAEQVVKTRSGTDWLPRWYAGQPLLVTANDYGQGLFNGDTGVVVRSGGDDSGLVAVFADADHPAGRAFALSRLADVQTAHALTIHRSQGSQFDDVTVVLPDVGSPLLTRELFYTAVTRARDRVRVVGSADAVREAVARRAQRASGLANRLAGSPTPGGSS